MVIKITLPPEYNPDYFPKGKGITISGQDVSFEGFEQKDVENIVCRYWRKQMPDGTSITRKTLSKSKALTSEEIALLKNVPDGYDPKKHTIYKMVAANTVLDRDSDQFTGAYLKAMADSLNKWGASLLFNHNPDHIIGKVFYAEVVNSDTTMGQQNLIEYAMIMPNASLPNQPGNSIMDNIEAGVITDASVRFGGYSAEIKEIGDSYVRVIDIPKQGEVIHPETSLVWFPAQFGAGLKFLAEKDGKFPEFNFKSFNPATFTKSKMPKIQKGFQVNGKTLNLEIEVEGDTFKPITGESELQKEITALETKASKFDALEKELTEAKQPSINNILNLSGDKGLKKSYIPTEAELKTKALKELQAMETDLTNELRKSQPENQLIKAIPATTEEEKKEEGKKEISTLEY